MTLYIAAYDVEQDSCLDGLERIVELHTEHAMPATFFVVSQLLEKHASIFRSLLDANPLFEIASHTVTHALLREHTLGGPAVPAAQRRTEIIDSKRHLEDFFGQSVRGFRTPYGFEDGLTGAPELLGWVQEAGYQYLSCAAWGPDTSLPAPLREPFRHDEDGYADLWEIPPCGWHENLLKGNNDCGPIRVLLYPASIPEAQLSKYVETPEEEFAVHRIFLDRAMASGMGHVSLIWHPWSLHRFDPEMKMLDLTFRYVRDRGMAKGTFADRLRDLNAAVRESAPKGVGMVTTSA